MSSPIFRFVGAVPLSSVLEPVADLYRRQAGDLCQLALLARRRVRVVIVPVPERRPRPLLEAVRRLLAVPDRPRQRELPPYAVLADGAQRPTTLLLRLDVVRLEPERLEFGVVVRREDVRLEQLVEFFELSAVKRYNGLSLEHALVLVEVLAGRKRPEEPSQPVDVAGVLQDLADAGDLLLGEAERR